MANIQRTYTGGATPSTLAVAMSAGSPGSGGTIALTVHDGWPQSGTFAMVIDRNTANEETVLCTSLSGTGLAVVAPGGRGFDGTDAQSHDLGAPVEHCFDAVSAQAFVDHLNDVVPADTHPMLLRTAAHTLAAHDDLGLVTKAGHDQALHTSPPLSLLSQSAHDLALHENLGLMSDDDYVAAHTLDAHKALGVPTDKAAIDALHVDAKTWDGWDHHGLRNMMMPQSVRVPMDSAATGSLSPSIYRTVATLPMPLLQGPLPGYPLHLLMFGGGVQFFLSGAGGGVAPIDVTVALTGAGNDNNDLAGITIYDTRTQRVEPGYDNVTFTTMTMIPDITGTHLPLVDLRVRAKIVDGTGDTQLIPKAAKSVTLWLVVLPIVPDWRDLTVTGP